MSRNGKVMVAMSGGVDSSVAAAILHEQGYEVVGVFMRLGAEPQPTDACRVSLPIFDAAEDRPRGCCSAVDAADARAVAARLNVPLYALNFERDFAKLKQNFADEYVNGRTPNPCVRCNQWLKFGRLEDYANVMEAEFIATGHYARLRHDDGMPRLSRGRSGEKDQSYVLFGVAPHVLARTLFPIGELTKDEVRAEGRRLGLAVHDKPESQDICFVPDGNYFDIVQRHRPEAAAPGEIRHIDGRLLGAHRGVAGFTIGQRRGVGVAAGEPVYVTGIDAESATVFVGPRSALCSNGLMATDVNWLPAAEVNNDDDAVVPATIQIRYHHSGAPGVVRPQANDSALVEFDEPVDAVTPGQAAVFYRGDEVLGGGWIERSVGSH